MDKNTVIGLLLIIAILVGFNMWMRPSEEELKEQQRVRDSIYAAQKTEEIANELIQQQAATQTPTQTPETEQANPHQDLKNKYGHFVNASLEPENAEPVIIENEKYKIQIGRKGGRIESVELKGLVTFDSLPVVLFTASDPKNSFGFSFYSNYLELNTNDLYFTPALSDVSAPIKLTESEVFQFSMRVHPDQDENTIDSSAYIEYIYTVRGNDYLTDVQIHFQGMKNYINTTQTELSLQWTAQLRQQEKGYKNEKIATTIFFSDVEDVENLSESDTKSDSIVYPAGLKWISFKQQFFTSTIIAKDNFLNATLVSNIDPSNIDKNRTLKTLKARMTFPISNLEQEKIDFQFYFGPNKYNILKQYNIQLEDQIQLGGVMVSWINKLAVIPIFNFFEKRNLNYGIIILILTIILKMLLLPLAYKSYMSTAKMRAAKPELDEINKRYPNPDDAMKKQQAVMGMYRQLGIKPMAGCLPMLLQMPILIAMFRFFPSAYELRQQPFLWANDLSTYDSVLDLPFSIPFYGDHVSLFTLLMTIATLAYTILNNKLMTNSGNEQQMKMMKWMMYLMPVMFLGIFNNYSSGLSYYYLLVNIITFIQMGIFRAAINEDKLHKKMIAIKAKPAKKSKWQQRMEDMMKTQQAMAQQQKKGSVPTKKKK